MCQPPSQSRGEPPEGRSHTLVHKVLQRLVHNHTPVLLHTATRETSVQVELLRKLIYILHSPWPVRAYSPSTQARTTLSLRSWRTGTSVLQLDVNPAPSKPLRRPPASFSSRSSPLWYPKVHLSPLFKSILTLATIAFRGSKLKQRKMKAKHIFGENDLELKWQRRPTPRGESRQEWEERPAQGVQTYFPILRLKAMKHAMICFFLNKYWWALCSVKGSDCSICICITHTTKEQNNNN